MPANRWFLVPEIDEALANFGEPANGSIISDALRVIAGPSQIVDWHIETRPSLLGPKRQATVDIDFRAVLLAAGMALSRAWDVSDVSAWHALIAHRSDFKIINAELHATGAVKRMTQRERQLFGEQLGVGAALIILYRLRELQIAVDFEEYLATGSIIAGIFDPDSSTLLRTPPKRGTKPDLIGVTSDGRWRFAEAKGGFGYDPEADLKKGKTQAERFDFDIAWTAPPLVVASLFPKVANQPSPRPLSVVVDPPSREPTIVRAVENNLARASLASGFALFGFRKIARELLADDRNAPRRALDTINAGFEGQYIPLYRVQKDFGVVIDRRVLKALGRLDIENESLSLLLGENLSFADDRLVIGSNGFGVVRF